MFFFFFLKTIPMDAKTSLCLKKKCDSYIIFFREDRDIVNGQKESVIMLSIAT